MKLPRLVLFGAGGHAREVAQIVRDINAVAPRWQLLGALVDANYHPGGECPGPSLPVLGDAGWLAGSPDAEVLVAIGDPAARRRIVHELRARHAALRFATLVHPRAWIAAGSEPGEGSVVFAGALVNVDVRIGAHVSINLGCTISHDCRIGDFASLGPGVHLPGRVQVGEAADLGAGCSSRPQARIGAGVVLGAGAVAIGDLPDGCVAVGVPARTLRR